MLYRKLFRDLRKNIVQFFSIFLMSFLGIYIFVGLDSEVTGGFAAENKYYEETNLADLWVTGKAFTAEDVKKIEGLDKVRAAERRIQADGKADLEGEPSVQMNFLTTNEVSKMKILDGEAYNEGAKGVWLDYLFAEKNNLKVGDPITLKLDSVSFSTTVKGTFYHPEYVYYLQDTAALMPDYGAYGFAFLSVEEYPFPDKAYYNQVIIDAAGIDNTGGLNSAEKERGESLGEEIKKILDQDTLIVTDKDSSVSYQTFHNEMQQHEAMAYMFPAVFLLISMLGIITTMTRLMANQRIQIGTMKALGFSKKSILLHYISYGFFLSLFGSVLGAVCGYFTIPDLIIGMFETTYLIPDMKKSLSAKALASVILEVAVSSAITWYACRREGKLPPAVTLKPASPGKIKHSAIEKSRIWLKLDFSTQWNIRDILRNKVRTCMGMFGVVGCSMLLLCAFGCLDTIEYITGWMYGELNTASYRIVMNESASYDDTSEYAKKYDGQMIMTDAVEMEAGGVKKAGSLTVLGQGNYMHYQNEEGEHITLPRKGISLSYRMAQSLQVSEGDFLVWHKMGDDRYHRMRVAEIYRNPSVQGITMYREAFEELDYRFRPGEILTNRSVPVSLSDEDAVAGVQNMTQMMDALGSMKEMMYMMVGILIVAATVLGIVVLYNLGVLSMVEKMREMATLKVLGFTTKKIRQILQSQNIWVTTAGILAGLPAGYGLLYVMFQEMPESMDYAIVIYPQSYLFTIVGTFFISTAVNQWLSRKVKVIDMVDALKGQE